MPGKPDANTWLVPQVEPAATRGDSPLSMSKQGTAEQSGCVPLPVTPVSFNFTAMVPGVLMPE
jgi:hypothetical protein